MQAPDATICSNNSAYAMGNSLGNIAKQEPNKIKAYVDFTEFNKNYQEYLDEHGEKESSTDSTAQEISMKLDRQSSRGSNQSSDWEILQ